jgi:signal transduction histidine kinase
MVDRNNSSHLLLLVDDEEDIRDVLQLPLIDLGYDVLTADNAEMALTIFRSKGPDIVLTDIKMPGMDGIELLREIKKERSDTEVIMITGHGDMDLAIKSLKYEATDFVIKPIHVDTLEIALDRAEERIRTRLQLREHTRNLEQLIQEKTEIQDHLSSLGLLVSSVSHGIKGLLTRLDGGVYLIDSGLKKENFDQIAEGRDTLKQSTVRIKKMVQDILYYAKERPLNPEAVNTAAFIEEVVATVRPRPGRDNIDLVVDVERAPPTLVIESESLHTALIGILDNALEACEKERTRKTHRIEVCVEGNHRTCTLTIKDDGIGMDRDTCERLFSLFFSSKGHAGTGLGLFIANKIVAQHHGSITVESELGRGSVFRIEIPILDAAE